MFSHLDKFELNWMGEKYTSFTKWFDGQKGWELMEGVVGVGWQ